ncbi:MAG: hypothetical protein R2860_04065 [Desulfobacterales bacterium]
MQKKAKNRPVSLRLQKPGRGNRRPYEGGPVVLYFAKTSNFEKTIKTASGIRKSAGYFGGKAKMEKEIASQVIRDLFYKNIRTHAEFYECMPKLL